MLHPVDTAHLSVLVAARPRVQREHMSCLLPSPMRYGCYGSSSHTGSLPHLMAAAHRTAGLIPTDRELAASKSSVNKDIEAHPHRQGAHDISLASDGPVTGSSPPTGSSHFLARVNTRH